MSLEIVAKLICDGDGCDVIRMSDVEYKATKAKWIVIDLRRTAEQEGWVTISRGRYHTNTHYCPLCADKPMKPVPRKQVAKRQGGGE